MIDVFFYSIAGKKTNDKINDSIISLLKENCIPSKERDILTHTLEVSNHGNYPSEEYYKEFYNFSYKIKSLAEILSFVDKVLEFYKKNVLQKNIISAFNDSSDLPNLLDRLQTTVAGSIEKEANDLDGFDPCTYTDVLKRPGSEGYKIGVPEIDELTNGFQPGTVGSIAAFVGEGKTTCAMSFAFKNALLGRKILYMSIELPPEMLWLMFQARYLFEVKSLQVTTQDLICKKLSPEKQKAIASFDEDFKRDIASNILILDESVLSKKVVGDAKLLSYLFKKAETKLGGLDITIWDHVGQLELMFPTMGNSAIRNITGATKTYTNLKGYKLFTMILVQVNREGKKRASKKNGAYDLPAISDLNEVERSSTYCIFLYTSDDMKIVQETKMCMLKHRLGQPLPEPVVTVFNPSVITVGSDIQQTAASADDFNGLDIDSFNDDF